MADIFSVKLQGGWELDRALYKMERKASRNLITRAVRRALNPTLKQIRKEVKSNLHTMNARARAVFSGQIGLSMKVERGGVVGRIRTKSTKAKTAKGLRNFAKLAHLFEKGTRPHAIKQKHRTIQHPGIKATPIWAETFEARAEEMGREYRDYIFSEIFGR
jgi:hypothetical protein